MGWDFIFGPARFSVRVAHRSQVAGEEPNLALELVDPSGLIEHNLIQILNDTLPVREEGFDIGQSFFRGGMLAVHGPILERFQSTL
jgi:hypothetical protein